MSAVITTYSGVPTISGQLVGDVTVTAGSEVSSDENSSLAGMLSTGTTTLFRRTGTNEVFFHTTAPITFTIFKIWLAEDYQVSNRSAKTISLYGSTNTELSTFTLIDTITLNTPYYTNYNSDQILVTDTVASVTYQYFILSVVGYDWLQGGDGPRIVGFQIS